MYGVVVGSIFQLKIKAQPEKGGSRVQAIISYETSGNYTASRLMDALFVASGLPQMLDDILLEIRAKVEYQY